LWVLHEVAKDCERLATKLNLLVVAPQTLRVEIQPKRGERQQESLQAVERAAYTPPPLRSILSYYHRDAA
jgi:hypothetical protein